MHAQQAIVLAGDAGRRFDGIGALSAGASSRLLVDYPEPARSRILDLLFTPGVGAALQILRVEIGSDVNSTTGSEPSHMRRRDEVDPGRGYEWWLMEEARRRNPAITLAGLAWGAPGWLDGGFWSQDNIEQHVTWLECARERGLGIDYLGGWNESETFEPSWFVGLKKAMRDSGFSRTGIIAADGWGDDLAERWKVADAMASDPQFCAAVDVVAVHYPCGQQYNGAPYDHGPSTETARASGKPLWSGEQGAQRYDIGAAPLAKAINRSYIDGRMTATVNWALTASFSTSVQGAGVGLLRAYQPWSGYYEASLSLWSVAHTTQFASPGWRYVDDACGYLDGGGSFVLLRSPGGDHYSVVVETVDASEAQTVRFSMPGDGGSSARPVHVWTTDLRSESYDDWFRQSATVTPTDGAYELTLEPGRLYSLTTTTGQGKPATGRSGADRVMALPYEDDFTSASIGRTPRLWSDWNGAFEVTARPDGDRGCLEQVVTTPPLEWRYTVRTTPLTVLGDPRWWGDYAVSVDVRLHEAPHVDLLGRVDGVLRGQGGEPGYRLRLVRDGRWSLLEVGPDRVETVLAAGALHGVEPERWYRLGLSFRGSLITAYVDGSLVGRADDERHNRGQVGLVVGDWARARFGRLVVTPTGPAPELVPQNEMRAVASSERLGEEARNVLDANPSSMWLSEPVPDLAAKPQSITLDLGRPRPARALLYTPRFDGDPRGVVTSYVVAVGVDGDRFTPVARGTWPVSSATKVVPLTGDDVRFVRLEAHGGGQGQAGAAELDVAVRCGPSSVEE
ncbi:MAG TPA: discoidin domain-containing protein [Actinopolymorphaceae bacterium]